MCVWMYGCMDRVCGGFGLAWSKRRMTTSGGLCAIGGGEMMYVFLSVFLSFFLPGDGVSIPTGVIVVAEGVRVRVT